MLLRSCSLPRDTVNIGALACGVRDSESLIRLAEEHGVLAHLASALASVPDGQISSTLRDLLRARHRLQLLFSLTMTAELFRILDLLRQSNIESVVVKGPVLSLRAYGDPAARRYVDLDLLLRQSDLPRAAGILVAAGYESRVSVEAIRASKIPGEYLFRRLDTNIIFELHTEQSFRYSPLPLPIGQYLQHKTLLQLDGQPVPALCGEHELALISIHGAKHFWERLMWIADVAAMVHNHPELDWGQVRRSAADVGAGRMVRVALLLAERTLGVPVPKEMKREVARDSACLGLVRQIDNWLPFGSYRTPSLVPRAAFRFRIRGNAFAGLGYLARLSLSTTEEDWSGETARPRSRFVEMLGRPFRLARKYRRDPDS